MSYTVKLQNVTKKYKMHSKKSEKLKSLFVPNSSGSDFYAVSNINYEAYKGDVVGIIGINGSGKSTLSNLIADITSPSSGNIDVRGEVSLIAVAAGLNKELTGRENIEIKCLMMGLNKDTIERLKPSIIEFADIGNFIDMPVKKYSSGMKSRLGFAISISADPDVLIIDEALSVGDQTFADKCLEKLEEFKQRGKTIFFISHSAAQVKKFCTKALWLEHGEVREQGTIEEVLPNYQQFIKEYKSMSKDEKKSFKNKGIEKQQFKAESKKARKRVKRNTHKRIIYNFLLLSLLLLTVFSYINKGEISSYFNNFLFNSSEQSVSVTKADKAEKINNNDQEPIQETKSNGAQYVQYVSVPAAQFHKDPDTNAEIVETKGYGYPVTVERQEDNGWTLVTTAESKDIWVNSNVISSIPNEEQINKEKVIQFLDISVSDAQLMKELLGKNKVVNDRNLGKPLLVDGQYRYDNGITVVYNKEFVSTQVIINTTPISIEELKSSLGEPGLINEEKNTMIYRTKEYDYKFEVSNGGEFFKTLTIISPKT